VSRLVGIAVDELARLEMPPRPEGLRNAAAGLPALDALDRGLPETVGPTEVLAAAGQVRDLLAERLHEAVALRPPGDRVLRVWERIVAILVAAEDQDQDVGPAVTEAGFPAVRRAHSSVAEHARGALPDRLAERGGQGREDRLVDAEGAQSRVGDGHVERRRRASLPPIRCGHDPVHGFAQERSRRRGVVDGQEDVDGPPEGVAAEDVPLDVVED
jgi:hypothetical protein